MSNTIPERLARMEERQEAHEEKNKMEIASLSSKIEQVHGEVKGLSPIIAEINDSLATLASDKLARDAVDGDRRTRGMDSRDWVSIAVAILVAGATIYGVMK